jgi:hypothetical protein
MARNCHQSIRGGFVITAIQPLKKVKLSITAGSRPGSNDLTALPLQYEFLYGIGPQGLEPFEAALHGKALGECLTVTVAASEAPAFFGRFFQPVLQLLALHTYPAELFLSLSVEQVTDAENREVVKALAREAGHGGCGGSCDCGCG